LPPLFFRSGYGPAIQAIKDRLNIDPPHVLAEDFQGMLMTFVQGRKKECLKQPKTKCFPKNRWFDEECKAAKRRVNDAKKVFLQCLNMQNRVEFFPRRESTDV